MARQGTVDASRCMHYRALSLCYLDADHHRVLRGLMTKNVEELPSQRCQSRRRQEEAELPWREAPLLSERAAWLSQSQVIANFPATDSVLRSTFCVWGVISGNEPFGGGFENTAAVELTRSGTLNLWQKLKEQKPPPSRFYYFTIDASQRRVPIWPGYTYCK